VTTKTAQRHLHKLVEDGLVAREGDKKGTKYFLKEDQVS
jgi:predicted ArsR family transcriptional regulator